LAGRMYPVKVEESRVDSIRKLEKQLNEQIRKYEMDYQDLDRIDSLSMTLVTCAFDLHLSQNTSQNQKLLNQIEELEKLADQALV